jgi:hypothetical protein
MAVEIYVEDNLIILEYSPNGGTQFILQKFKIDSKEDQAAKLENICKNNQTHLKRNLKNLNSKYITKNKFKLYQNLLVENRGESVLNDYTEALSFVIGYKQSESEYYVIPTLMVQDHNKKNLLQKIF